MPSIAHLRVEAPHDDRACDVKVLLKCAGFVCEFDGRFCTHNANNGSELAPDDRSDP
jgi:hypothetical protein